MDGSVTVIPGFIDFHAEHSPNRPWVKFPSTTEGEKHKALTFLDFAQATHRVAHILRPGRHGVDGEVVALLIHCDTVLYLATLAGVIRAGLVVCLLPRRPYRSITVDEYLH